MTINKYAIIVMLGLIFPVLAFAQRKKKEEYKFLKVNDIVVDGNLSEWEGRLYNGDSEVWSAGISVVGDSIYAAVVIKNQMLQQEALVRGIVFNLSYNARKRDGAQLIFPVADPEGLRALRHSDERSPDNYRQDLLNTTRGYYVIGFDRVVDGLLSFNNSYAIRAAVRLDSTQISYEAVIPLDLVNFKSDEIAVKLGVDTQFSRLKAQSNNQRGNTLGRYGMYAPRQSTPKNPYDEATEIWVTGPIK